MEKNKPKYELIAAKPNFLIGSKDGFENIHEYRILLGMFLRAYMGVDITKEFTLDIKYILGGATDGGKNYRNLKSACRSIVRRCINLLPEDAYGFMFRNVVSVADYTPLEKTGNIVVQFSIHIVPHIFQMFDKDGLGYTKVLLRYALPIRSLYSVRLYEFLLRNKFRKKIIVPLNDLRDLLGVPKTAFLIWGEFNRNVLVPAQKNMKKHTNLSFKYTGIRTERKIGEIEFIIKDNVPEHNWLPELDFVEDENFVNNYDEHLEHIKIVRENIWEKSQQEAINNNSREKIKYYYKKLNDLLSSGKNINDHKAYFYALLKNDEDNYEVKVQAEKAIKECQKKEEEAKRRAKEEMEKEGEKREKIIDLAIKYWPLLSSYDQNIYMAKARHFQPSMQRDSAAASFVIDHGHLFEDSPDEKTFLERYKNI